MKFSIITPTHKRADKLVRAVHSVQAQTYQDWEMIIVNDSPHDDSYIPFASSINDPRIHYHINTVNSGVNYSRNKALDAVSAHSDWIIFLDDDDYLAPDTLQMFHDLILSHVNTSWFVTNRAEKNGTPFTKAPGSDRLYSYARDYLLLRRIKGDATHAIRTKCIHTIRFSKKIRQGEEWFFFYQLGLKESFFYHDHNSTISDGYTVQGLNFRKRNLADQVETLSVLAYEGLHVDIFHRPTFFVYLVIRFLKALFI